jgi:hypothetical protein
VRFKLDENVVDVRVAAVPSVVTVADESMGAALDPVIASVVAAEDRSVDAVPSKNVRRPMGLPASRVAVDEIRHSGSTREA